VAALALWRRGLRRGRRLARANVVARRLVKIATARKLTVSGDGDSASDMDEYSAVAITRDEH